MIAVIMLGSILASYALIIMNGGGAGSSSNQPGAITEEQLRVYEEEYAARQAEFATMTKGDFDKFIQYKSNVKAFNETAANDNGLQVQDLVVGDGRKIEDGDQDYVAYYIGWCADGSVFDASLDDFEHPTGFSGYFDVSLGAIEGWGQGMVGARLGGVREMTIPGKLAYGDSMEICGGYNKPLKFMVMPITADEQLKKAFDALTLAGMKLQYAEYGIDYGSVGQ